MFWFCGECGTEFNDSNEPIINCINCNEELHRGHDVDCKGWCD